MNPRKALWKNDAQFNAGPPTLDNVGVYGGGDAAFVRLLATTAFGDDEFINPLLYSFDPAKIEVAAGARLVSAGTTFDYPFTVAGDYTFDPVLIEIVASKAKLKALGLIVPYAWWHLNEAAGVTAADSSGHGRNGTLTNMEAGDWVAGKLNNCLQFDGVNEYVDCGAIAGFERTDSFSIETWFNSASAASQIIVCKAMSSGAYTGYQVYLAAGKITVDLVNSYATINYIRRRTTAATYASGTWRHLVVTYNGSSSASGVLIYVDGVLVATDTVQDTLSATMTNAINFKVGILGTTTNGFVGKLDEIVVYDLILTASDVTYRYNGGTGIETMQERFSTASPSITCNTGFIFATPASMFIETATKPVGTELKYQVSSDDGVTWKWWNGATWATRTPGQTEAWYYTNEANLASVVHANISTLALSGTMRFKAFLHADAETATPLLDNIRVGDLAYPTGSYVLTDLADIHPPAMVAWQAATETATKPASTSIEYQYSIDSGGTWNGSWLSQAALEAAIQSIPCVGDGSDKIRFKVQLTTASIYATPEITNLRLTYATGYALTGSYTSTKYIPTPSTTNGIWVGKVTFDVETPVGTAVTVRARTVDNVLEANYAKPWTAYASGDTIDAVGQFIQFEAVLTTASAFVTPKLNGVEVEFHNLSGVVRALDDVLDGITVLPL